MENTDMIRCPHCGALVDRDPTDDKQYCQACHKIFRHADAGLFKDAGKTQPCTTDGDLVHTWEEQSETDSMGARDYTGA